MANVPEAKAWGASVASEEVLAFLRVRRLALVGVSRHPEDFSRAVFREFVAHGYDVVPIHPSAEEIEGRKAYARVGDLAEPVGGALVMTPPAASAKVVEECLAAGVPRIWLHRGSGQGSVSREAVELCRAHGVAVVAGQCPMMFVGDSGVHRVHAIGRMLAGGYPSVRGEASRLVRTALIVLLLLVGVGALYGGVALVADPSGGLLEMSADLLARSPFATFLVPGLILLVAVGGSSLFAAGAEALGRPAAPWLSILAGLILTGWMAGELVLIPGLVGIQVVFAVLALALLGLAVLALRRRRPILRVLGPSEA